jgi:hypothetical protein
VEPYFKKCPHLHHMILIIINSVVWLIKGIHDQINLSCFKQDLDTNKKKISNESVPSVKKQWKNKIFTGSKQSYEGHFCKYMVWSC